jgi:hypothetical protein
VRSLILRGVPLVFAFFTSVAPEGSRSAPKVIATPVITLFFAFGIASRCRWPRCWWWRWASPTPEQPGDCLA